MREKITNECCLRRTCERIINGVQRDQCVDIAEGKNDFMPLIASFVRIDIRFRILGAHTLIGTDARHRGRAEKLQLGQLARRTLKHDSTQRMREQTANDNSRWQYQRICIQVIEIKQTPKYTESKVLNAARNEYIRIVQS
ncbi:hypothetical protein SCLCIDRAFT_377577 [Scleroderma citrinum Foug A]|uniref:Uncharacterized protein n=1 Tax=Scleroderma citrinum Foug A TaxID=1036808 RepID=A0A0C2ZPF6_9AGAM|nr:hypothetical protein SCLCIDRAFT_377577 [Scleroderma citrinum Foug A]